MSSSTKSETPRRSRGSHTTERYEGDPRLYVAALLKLAALGWYVTAIRPDRSAPLLWRVTVVRYDLSVWISAIDADPDDALAEIVRYAAADAATPAAPPDAAPSDAAPPNAAPPNAAPSATAPAEGSEES